MHLIDKVGFFSKRNGISGGHNYDMFKKYFDDVQMPYKEVSRISHPDIDGIYDIKYKVGAKNYQGVYEVNKWTSTIYKKTVYDPNKISDDDIIKWAEEALNDAASIVTDGGQEYIKGAALNGLKFEGWIDNGTGEIKSFYPVFNWNQ